MSITVFDGKSLQQYNDVSNYYVTLRFLVITFEDNNKVYIKLSEVKNFNTSKL